MTPLEVGDGFDVHDYREELKLRHRDVGTYRFDARGDLACPACGRRVDRLLVTTERAVSFDTGPDGPFCLVRTGGEQLLVATHADA